jgi:hypothetical protein
MRCESRLPRGSTRLVRLGVIGLAMTLFVGCITSAMGPQNLPEEPIAFLHWSGRAGTKRTSILEKALEQPPSPGAQGNAGRLREDEVRTYLRAEISVPIANQLSKYPGRLTLYWPRTGKLEPVEAAPFGSRPLAWSSDHQRLLFATGHRGEKEQLYEYDLAAESLRRITTGPDEHPRGDYASNGGFIVQRMRRYGSRGAAEMTVHRADRGGRLGAPIAYDVPPGSIQVTPDESVIVYEQVRTRSRRGAPTVFESMIAARRLGAGAPEEILLRGREPTLTPDGQWIVFASASSAGYRLRRMRPDGTARMPIGPGGTEERMPSVSPDGQFIAFVQMSEGNRSLVVRRFDGKGERKLVSEGSSEFPVW